MTTQTREKPKPLTISISKEAVDHVRSFTERASKTAHVGRCVRRVEPGDEDGGAEDLGEAGGVVVQVLPRGRAVLGVELERARAGDQSLGGPIRGRNLRRVLRGTGRQVTDRKNG